MDPTTDTNNMNTPSTSDVHTTETIALSNPTSNDNQEINTTTDIAMTDIADNVIVENLEIIDEDFKPQAEIDEELAFNLQLEQLALQEQFDKLVKDDNIVVDNADNIVVVYNIYLIIYN